MITTRPLRLALALLVIAAAGGTSLATELYWVNYSTGDDGSIYRADVDNFVPEPVIPGGLHQPYRIAVEPRIGKMFWTSIGLADAGGIFSANLDGTGIQEIVPASTSVDERLAALTIDRVNRKLYFSQGRQIKSVNFDGSELTTIGTPALDLIQDLAVDPGNQKIYFSDNFNPLLTIGRLRRVNYDGSGVEVLGTIVPRGPIGVDLDLAAGKVYWARSSVSGLASMQRSNLDGTQRESLATDNGDSLALDLEAGKMYWSYADGFSAPGHIRRSNLDGTNVETVFLSSTLAPGGITIVPEPATCVLLLVCAIGATRRRWGT